MPVMIQEKKLLVLKDGNYVETVANYIHVNLLVIDPSIKRVMIQFQYGRVEGGKFAPVGKSETVMITGEDFDKIASISVVDSDVGKTLYQLVGEKVYTWLLSNDKIWK